MIPRIDVKQLLFFCCLIHPVLSHGRLIKPPARSSMWRYGFKNPKNYDDNALYCGGRSNQHEKQGGKCGVCGDPYQGPRENEPGGKYANGIVVKKYKPGQVISITVHITANHMGWFQFFVCPKCHAFEREPEKCFEKLKLKSGKDTYYILTKKSNVKLHFKVKLPKGMKCPYCVLRWKYNTGNSWGTAANGTSCVGCGPQEQFYGCADVSIGKYAKVKVGKKPVRIDTCKPKYPIVKKIKGSKKGGATVTTGGKEEVAGKKKKKLTPGRKRPKKKKKLKPRRKRPKKKKKPPTRRRKRPRKKKCRKSGGVVVRGRRKKCPKIKSRAIGSYPWWYRRRLKSLSESAVHLLSGDLCSICLSVALLFTGGTCYDYK